MGRLEPPRLILAEEVVAVHEDDPLGRRVRFFEDLVEVLDGLAAEARAGGKVPVDVLDLLLALLDRLRDVRGDGVGGGDVDQERHTPLLGEGRHRVGRSRVKRPHQHPGTPVHDTLGLDAAVLGLGLRVTDDQLELDAALRLDAARRVDCIGGHLSAQTAGLPGFGERTRHGMNDADLERLRLRAERQRKSGDGCAGGGRLEKPPPGQSMRCHHEPPPRSSLAMIMRWIWFVPS